MSHNSLDVFRQAQLLINKGEAFVIVTLLGSAGHAPQDPGAKALITQDGVLAGTVGGGKVEAKAISIALETLEQKTSSSSKPLLLHWDLQKDLGMSCGGSVEMLFESFQTQPWSIAVFGAGHVAQALVRILMHLDCRVICLDSRSEWIARLPESAQLVARCEADLPRVADDLPAGTYAVVVTMGHATDLPILRRLLPRTDLPYIGVIGSTVKARRLRAELLSEGYSPQQVQALHCPIGLPIGSNQPGEIAISIIAQLLGIRDQHRVKRND